MNISTKITVENVFEQIAFITKMKLIQQGVLPADANDLAIEFAKQNAEKIIKNLSK
jgi:hypothetical protein